MVFPANKLLNPSCLISTSNKKPDDSFEFSEFFHRFAKKKDYILKIISLKCTFILYDSKNIN